MGWHNGHTRRVDKKSRKLKVNAASDLTRPLNRAAIWGVSLFGTTLPRRPRWAYGDREMERGRHCWVAVSLLLTCGVLVACSDKPRNPMLCFGQVR
jgi:hypothetical protein